MMRRYAKNWGVLSGCRVESTAASVAKHSVQTVMSVIRPRLGFGARQQASDLSSSWRRHASGNSSAMSMNSSARIFFQSFGGKGGRPGRLAAAAASVVSAIGSDDVVGGVPGGWEVVTCVAVSAAADASISRGVAVPLERVGIKEIAEGEGR